MSNSLEIINQQVDELISKGNPVDIYKLAAALEPMCPDTPVAVIAQLIAAEIVHNHGNAVWDPASKSMDN